MKTLALAGLLVMAASAVNAQRADCPIRDAPFPIAPPGKPPNFVPQATFPSRFDGEVKLPPEILLPAQEDLIEVEEGHVTAFARQVEGARADPPPPDVMQGLAKLGRTPLSQWRFEGYLPQLPRHRVSRVFTSRASTLVLEEWDMARDGASVAGRPPQALQIGRFKGNAGGFRAPSGCVAASLSWNAGGIERKLGVVGPMTLREQRALLLEIARAMEEPL